MITSRARTVWTFVVTSLAAFMVSLDNLGRNAVVDGPADPRSAAHVGGHGRRRWEGEIRAQ